MPAQPSSIIDQYLNSANADERIHILDQTREMVLPLSLSRDLMCMNLLDREHTGILMHTDQSEELPFEDFLTRGMFLWNQNVASTAIRMWAHRTNTLLSHRLLLLAFQTHVPQRISYTLLDIAWHLDPDRLIRHFADAEGLTEFSPAFHCQLLHKALQWNISHDRLLELARSVLREMHAISFSADKSLPYVIAYLCRFDPKFIESGPWARHEAGIWNDIIRNLSTGNPGTARFREIDTAVKNFREKPSGKDPLKKLIACWPSLWDRHYLPEETITETLRLVASLDQEAVDYERPLWELFAGIDGGRLRTCLDRIDSPGDWCRGLAMLGSLLPYRTNELQEKVAHLVTAAEDPGKLLGLIPMRLRILLNAKPDDGSLFGQVHTEARDTSTEAAPDNPADVARTFSEFSPRGMADSAEDRARNNFIKNAYLGIRESAVPGDGFWQKLTRAWQQPREEGLEDLVTAARRAPAIYQNCYIDTLGRFKGIDKAALKLLDFIRSKSPNTLSSLIQALAGIDTQRSLQELVAFLTRPNITFSLQMEIANILSDKNLGNLQSEIRSAISDMYIDPSEENLQWELRTSLTALLKVEVPQIDQSGGQTDSPGHSPEELDQLLANKIGRYRDLSSEAKRALRTAQFFHLNVNRSGNMKSIDLSPAIDMQYKALEISFRECFEESCTSLIKSGVLQRKLDVIGYARPFPPRMDEFERHLESLPIITTIPFFSRFKLRKMLRAICTYRKGKRFTLDGLKAFALFFICFSRKSCTYGLANQYPIRGIDDEELAEFVRTLHMFQDFRNRAAHEGFHPDASNDLDSIWRDTSFIVQKMFHIAGELEDLRQAGNRAS